MAQTKYETKTMPCGDVYPLTMVCMGMYYNGKLKDFCKKCPVCTIVLDAQWE